MRADEPTVVVTVTFDGDYYVARSDDPELASQGLSVSEALRNYAEAFEVLVD